MTTNDFLLKEAKRLKLRKFRGVFMRDELPKKTLVKECGIINLESSKEKGSHWCCWWKNKNKKYYFDPYGILPSKEMINYLESPINYSTFQIQQFNESNCGERCLDMLNKLNNGNNFQDIIFKMLNQKTF